MFSLNTRNIMCIVVQSFNPRANQFGKILSERGYGMFLSANRLQRERTATH